MEAAAGTWLKKGFTGIFQRYCRQMRRALK